MHRSVKIILRCRIRIRDPEILLTDVDAREKSYNLTLVLLKNSVFSKICLCLYLI